MPRAVPASQVAAEPNRMVEIYVDGDACPVKAEVLRVARRHRLTVHLVSNSALAGTVDPLIHRVMVDAGADAADDWIAAHIGRTDIVVSPATLGWPRGVCKKGHRRWHRPASPSPPTASASRSRCAI